ncbi:hypothetical protein [Pseudomonas sp. WC2]|uniref:hypothetical protein n=1 Tax=Pseudomonas sp. WC2 TaxID=3424773 RepID=UPI003D3270F2
MDVRIQAGLIAFCAALIVMVVTNWVNIQLAKRKFEEDKAKAAEENFREKREETVKHLFLLRTKLSITKLDMASGPSAANDFNDNYDSANENIAEIMMALTLYFPKAKAAFTPIEIDAATYWKNFKDYLSVTLSMPQTSPLTSIPANAITFQQNAVSAAQRCGDNIQKTLAAL